jgi:hypothetical protein
MLSTDLNQALIPFKLMVNKGALSQTYKSLEIGPLVIRGTSNYALLEVACGLLPQDDLPVIVDATSFIAVVASLPDKKEVFLEVKDQVLLWTCGEAKGRLATLPGIKMPFIDRPMLARKDQDKRWAPPPSFRMALDLGAISGGADSLNSSGMYGIVLDNRKSLSVMACDGTTISHATVMEGTLKYCPPLVVVSPEAVVLLRRLLQDGHGRIEFDDKSIFYASTPTGVRCIIKCLPQLKHDITTMLGKYEQGDIVAPIPGDRITAFIRRVGALADNRRLAHVGLGASKGRITLSFAEGTASSDEYYLVESAKIPDLPVIQIDAEKTARALAHVTEMILDHLDRHVIVMLGAQEVDKNEVVFTYMVSGKR